MIKVEVKTHDNFSVEFKTSFITEKNPKDTNDFKINTWVFVPNSLDINRATYSKDQFHKDVKTNLRLITPVFSLDEVLNADSSPIHRLYSLLDLMLADPQDESKAANYTYHTKMLLCVIKSAMRRDVGVIEKAVVEDDIIMLTNQFIDQIKEISEKYRCLDCRIKQSPVSDKIYNYYLFGDNFLGNLIEQHCFALLRYFDGETVFEQIKMQLNQLVQQEIEHKQEKEFLVLEKGNNLHNSLVILQRNALKKFVESDLFLHIVKKKDGAYAEQFYYSIAAGIAMIFATVISFFATQQLGNFTTDLFIVLIISYMLKDRIKELSRYYFATKLSKKYFDIKLKLSIRKREIGWIKEAFDFVEEIKVPDFIINMRSRTPLVEAENQIYDEKIFLYRKWVNLSKDEIEKYKEYKLAGINDITRFNLTNFVQKMDNPFMPIYYPDEEKGYTIADGMRVYPLVFILQCQTETTTYYKKYRFMFNRKGIKSISELD